MAATDIENILQYHFKDSALLEEALQADGSTPSTSREDPRKHGNKALAMIGDAVLRLVVVSDGIDGGKTLQGCQKVCAAEISNNASSSILNKWKMDRFVHAPSARSKIVPRTTAASTTEALIGAVWIDSDHDYGTVHGVIHSLGIAAEFTHNASHLADTIELQFLK